MTDETLGVAIAEIRPGLERGDYPDEAVVSQGIVMRVLAALNWPVFDPKVVRREHPIKNRKVDYALFGRLGTPAVLLEVKRVGRAARGEEQLFEYAFHQGARIVVLTDGRSWSLYLPGGEGRYADRCFAEVNLQADAPEVSATKLSRYLDHDAVRSGEARKRAEADWESSLRERTADETLPAAWSRLVSDASSPLVEVLGAAVEKACGVRPSEKGVTRFLQGLQPPRDRKPTPVPVPKRQGRLWLEIDGTREYFSVARDVIVAVFTELAKRDSSFCERFVAAHSGRGRQYIARSTQELYPTRPDLLPRSVLLPGGWWLGHAMSNSAKKRRIREACEVAGIEFGRDLKVRLSARKKEP